MRGALKSLLRNSKSLQKRYNGRATSMEGKNYAPELAQLDPIPKGSKRAIIFKRTEPASSAHILFGPRQPANKSLDPKHPWLIENNKSLLYRCPMVNTPYFSARIIPHGLLAHSDDLPPFMGGNSRTFDSKYPEMKQLSRYRVNDNRNNVAFMSLQAITAKATVHPSAVIRRKISRRIREAIKLIVTRGATADVELNHVVFNGADIGEEKWILRDWTYVVWPSLTMYRLPWPKLIFSLREALASLKAAAENHTAKLKENTSTLGDKPKPMRRRNPPGSPPSTRSFSTTSRTYSKYTRSRRESLRSEVALGTPESSHISIALDHAIPENLTLPLHESVILGDVEQSDSSFDVEEQSAVSLDEVEWKEDDFEGWAPSDSYAEDLLDGSNIHRFQIASFPQHAGRLFNRNIREHWNLKDETWIQSRFEEAAQTRRRKRKSLRRKWNAIPPSFLATLRENEEKRLRLAYGTSDEDDSPFVENDRSQS